MKAVLIEQFGKPPRIADVPEPVLRDDSVIVEVKASGICRSDWHGWMGHDSDVQLPHVPGHELAGEVRYIGRNVLNWSIGDRVTVPFSCGCGQCSQCRNGQTQICDNYFQPGFTAWGSFAERVEIRFADVNLVQLDESIDFVVAASLGCRFATSFRAVVTQGQVRPDDWVAIHGCGGVGLAAVMISVALGANVVAVDVEHSSLDAARRLGAKTTIMASKDKDEDEDTSDEIRDVTSGGADVSIDALGSVTTCRNSIRSLRKQGRHVQIGLLLGDHQDPPVPMHEVIGRELQLVGSHGMSAGEYRPMLDMIRNECLRPEQLIGRHVTLDEAPACLVRIDEQARGGITVIDRTVDP